MAGNSNGDKRAMAACIELTIKPDFLEVRRALKEIRDGLSPIVADDPMNTIEIVGAEILNNVVEHGFAGRAVSSPSIAVCAAVHGQRLKFRVVDDGRPMPGGTLPDGTTPDLDGTAVSALPEGGFGWGLIHMLAGDLSYCYADGKNQLEVSIDI